jgi:hypothetical protein
VVQKLNLPGSLFGFDVATAASKSMFPQSQFEGSYCQASTLSKMEPINIPEGKKLSGSSASGPIECNEPS